MNVRLVSEKQIARDAVKITLLSLAMQTMGMIFNVWLSDSAGTAAVGLMSLIFSLFSFIMVLANGNILTSTSRFISEARGAGHENFSRIMKYSLSFSFCLSAGFCVIFFALSDTIGERLLHSTQLSASVKLISLSLPFASAGSCIKGFFHGIRRVEVPMRGDLTEFAAKWASLFCGLFFFGGTDHFYGFVAASILIGEFASFCYYAVKYAEEYRRFSVKRSCCAPLATDTFPKYLKSTFPILLSGYVQMLMSTANELLVPAALLKYSKSTEQALSSYGMFEAMIIPAIFFPSAVLSSFSGIIIPEAALANRCEDKNIRRCRLQTLTDSAFKKSFTYSFFTAFLFLCCGRTLGKVLCSSDTLVSDSLVILAPVIPFIYLEIILEGLLKGMGRQNFSTVNSLAEYAVRIACVMIFVGKIGFGGVIVSYYASNVLSNIARIYVVCSEAELKFSVKSYVLVPAAKGILCCAAGGLAVKLTHAAHSGNMAVLLIFVLTAAAVFTLMYPGGRRASQRSEAVCGGAQA